MLIVRQKFLVKLIKYPTLWLILLFKCWGSTGVVLLVFFSVLTPLAESDVFIADLS